MKRRDFIRTVIVGGTTMATAGLSTERVYSSANNINTANTTGNIQTNRRHVVREPGHMIRDGHKFEIPEPTEFRDVVIVGAGANALFSAYHLPNIDLVCLEKEPRTGGNAQRGMRNGIYYTEGTAFIEMDSELVHFMDKEFNIKPLPAGSNDAYILGKKIIQDFYQNNFDNLPYTEKTKNEFRRFRSTIKEIANQLGESYWHWYLNGNITDPSNKKALLQLESINFEQWLKGHQFPKEVIDWCDLYCPPQVSGYPKDISAIMGILGMAWAGDYEEAGSYPGGLAPMAEALAEGVRKQGDDRIRTGTFVVRVANTADGKSVDVTYLQANKVHTIRCKACIWGGQKHIARHVISDMPKAQKEAIGKLVYNDISVMNLCYNKTIYNKAYYTWIDKAPINNILPADWVLRHGKGNDSDPQVLTCDWTNRPEYRALLLNDDWVVKQCQKTAHRLNEVFPGSIDHLDEIRILLRAHSWVANSPEYMSKLLPITSQNIGNIVMTRSDHSNFDEAMYAGISNANTIKKWLG